MGLINDISNKAAEAARRGGKYTIRRDGIAYCNTCGEPRQVLVDLDGEKKLVWCACKCQEAKIDRGDAERIAKMQQRGGVAPTYTFERAQLSSDRRL